MTSVTSPRLTSAGRTHRFPIMPSGDFRKALLPLLAAILAAGCITTPEYKDPLAAFQQTQAPKEGPFASQSLRVLLSENTQKSIGHMETTHRTMAAWGGNPGFEPRALMDELKSVLERRFRSVTLVTSEAPTPAGRADLTMVFDARVSIGTVSFTQNSVELAGIFTDESRQPVETVSGKGSSIVPWPAFIPSFPGALKDAFADFAKSLDGAAKLHELVTSRAGTRRAAATGPMDPAALRARVRGLAGRSWALVVGINNYRHADPLNAAVADARAVAAALPRLGFNEVRVLLDEQATKAEIERVIYGELKEKMGANDRLFVFWAGHGITVKLPRGGEEGYLMPVDGDPQRPELTAIAMDEVKKMGKRVNAKHVFFAIDSCFSGFALTRDIGVDSVPDAELAAAMEEPVVQVLTAGRRGQKAVEEEGHGLFTRRLLDGLRGLADQDRRGFVTVTQLAAWLSPRVVRDSGGRQHPQYSALEGEGDFVFVLPEGR